MIIDLSHNDLVALVMGHEPTYKQMQFQGGELAPYGTYSGSYGKWDWNRAALVMAKELQLYNLYLLLRRK